MNWLKKMTKDTASTIGGIILGAVGGAATAYANGGVTKEALAAGAAVGVASAVAGYLHNRGNVDPVMK